MPFARATGMGSTLDCADHSKSVCFLVRSTISWPVIVGVAIAVVIKFLWDLHCGKRALLLRYACERRFEYVQCLVHLRVRDDQRHQQANHVAVRSGSEDHQAVLITIL